MRVSKSLACKTKELQIAFKLERIVIANNYIALNLRNISLLTRTYGADYFSQPI